MYIFHVLLFLSLLGLMCTSGVPEPVQRISFRQSGQQLTVTEDRLVGHTDHAEQFPRLRTGRDILTMLMITDHQHGQNIIDQPVGDISSFLGDLSEDEIGSCEKVGQGRRLSTPGT